MCIEFALFFCFGESGKVTSLYPDDGFVTGKDRANGGHETIHIYVLRKLQSSLVERFERDIISNRATSS